MMEKATCDSCGKVVMESSIKDGKCWTCTRGEGIETDASSGVSSQGSNEVGESSQRAIDVLKIVNQINFICGVILALVIFFYFTDSLGNSFAGLVGAAVVGLVVVVVWAVNRVFVGIAEDVKGIRERLERD